MTETGIVEAQAPAPAQALDDTPSGSAARALRVLRVIVQHGPQRPDAVCARTGLSRSAVHRAVHALIDEGMVRYQLGRRQVALCGDWQRDLARQPASPGTLDHAVRIVEEVLRGRRVQADLAVVTAQAQFRILEATDLDRLDLPEDALESDLFITGLTLFDPVKVLAITTAVLKAEGRAAQAPDAEFLTRYREARKRRFLWEPHSRELSVPLRLAGDSALSLRLWSRETSPRKCRFYLEILEKMHQAAPTLFPEIQPHDV